MSIVLKNGSLNLLETYGPVQAWNGIALPLRYYVYVQLRALAEIILISAPINEVFEREKYSVSNELLCKLCSNMCPIINSMLHVIDRTVNVLFFLIAQKPYWT